MTKGEHINYWKMLAENDWKVMESLYQTEHYVYAIFFADLVLEKLSKALWVKNNERNFPPKTHNILYLLEGSNVNISDEIKKFIILINDFQLESRYPDYKMSLYKVVDKKKTDEFIEKAKEVKAWLLKMLQ